MDLVTLSASSANVFELCEARWHAEYNHKAKQPSGSPAALGTSFHAASEQYVLQGYYLRAGGGETAALRALWDTAYYENFADAERYDEGWEMFERWVRRTPWEGRKVLSAERKLNFALPTSIGDIPFNYIFDRCDRLDNGDIEVIDYKTWMAPLQPGNMKHKIQVRAYGLAAAIQFPDAPRVWITLDQTRYDPVSCSFTRDENKATWNYLKALAERIIAASPEEHGFYKESLNVDCRYCVRKHICNELTAHEAAGGPLGLTDPMEAADRRYRIESAKKAMDAMLAELDAVIMGYCEDEEMLEFSTEYVDVAITAFGKRVIDAGVAAKILGPLAAEFPEGLKIGVIDRLMKESPPRLSAEQLSALKQAIRKEYGDARVKVTMADPVPA